MVLQSSPNVNNVWRLSVFRAQVFIFPPASSCSFSPHSLPTSLSPSCTLERCPLQYPQSGFIFLSSLLLAWCWPPPFLIQASADSDHFIFHLTSGLATVLSKIIFFTAFRSFCNVCLLSDILEKSYRLVPGSQQSLSLTCTFTTFILSVWRQYRPYPVGQTPFPPWSLCMVSCFF
jgi:hypothetical protein